MSVTEGTILRIVASILFPDSVIMQNVFHVALSSLVGDGDPDDITLDLEDYVSQIYQNFNNQLSDELTGDEVKCYEYDAVDDDFDEIGTGSLDITPIGSADYLPHGVALVNNIYTLDPDVQGRKFWGGFTEASQADGDWNAAILTAAAAAAVDMVSQYTGAETGSTYTPGVWSPTRTSFYAKSGVVAIPATVGYQRRRKPGVGI
jgi:hypothetical protein